MNIWVYSDESGVFDKVHNDYYIYGGLIIIGDQHKGDIERKYRTAEMTIRKKRDYPKDYEIKATSVNSSDKNSLFRSLNGCIKFGAIVKQANVLENIFTSKKDKQRYLDYVYKIAVKKALQELIKKGVINPDDVEMIYFLTDEHSTATNGRYGLQQALEQELKYGTYNWNYSRYFPPVFPKMKGLSVSFCNSSKKLLVRAADIVANKIYYLVVTEQINKLDDISNLYYIIQP